MGQKNKELNPIAKAVKFYQTIVPSPLLHAGLIGTGGWLLSKYSMPAIQRALYNSALAATGRADDPKAIAQSEAIIQQQKNNKMLTKGVPIAIGSVLGLLSLAGNINFNKQWNGLLSWNAKDKATGIVKTQALNKQASFWQSIGYQPSCKFDQPIDTQAVYDIFKTNPVIRDNSYVRNFGTSIVAAAPMTNYNNTTLGGLYDSAVNKFQNKLTLHGVAKQGVKSVVAGSLAGLFTDTIGTVMGLPSSVRAPITKSVSLGSALYSILT